MALHRGLRRRNGFDFRFDRRPQRIEREGFGQEPETFLDNVTLYDLAVVVTGHEENLQVRLLCEKPVDQHGPAHSWHHDIGQEKIGAVRHSIEGLDGAIRATRPDNFITCLLQNRFDKVKHIRLIVDHQYCWRIVFRNFGHRLKSSLA
jgi:hypothetical protein